MRFSRILAAMVLGASFTGCVSQVPGGFSRTTTLGSSDVTLDEDFVSTTDGRELSPAARRDLEITRRLHRAIATDASLSADARHCSITTRDGFVIIRGTASRADRAAISAHAQRIVPTPSIDNEVQVRP